MPSSRKSPASLSFCLNDNQRGQFTPLLIIAALFIVIAVGFVVDVGRVYVAKQQIQNAVDSTLIGVGERYIAAPDDFDVPAISVNDALKTALKNTLELNFRKLGLFKNNGWPCDQSIADTFVRTDVTPAGAADPIVAIDCNHRVDTWFMDLLSFQAGSFNFNPAQNFTLVRTSADFSLRGGKPTIMLIVLDFSDSVTGQVPDRIRVAALEALYKFGAGDFVGVTTFNEGYNGGPSKGDTWFTNVLVPFTMLTAKVVPNSGHPIENLINAKIVKKGTRFGTYGQGGLYMARKMFRSLSNTSLPLPWSDYNKAIFFVSDGILLHSRYHAYPEAPAPLVTGIVPGEKCIPDPLHAKCSPPQSFPPKVRLTADEEAANPGYKDPWQVTNVAAGVNLPSDLDLQLGWKHTCGKSDYGAPQAAREADLARLEGIEIFSFCTKCGPAVQEMRMRRIAADVSLNKLDGKFNVYKSNPDLGGATDNDPADGVIDWYEWASKGAEKNWRGDAEIEQPDPNDPEDQPGIPKCAGYDGHAPTWNPCWVDPLVFPKTCPETMPRHLEWRERYFSVDPTNAANELAEAFKKVADYLKAGRLSM